MVPQINGTIPSVSLMRLMNIAKRDFKWILVSNLHFYQNERLASITAFGPFATLPLQKILKVTILLRLTFYNSSNYSLNAKLKF